MTLLDRDDDGFDDLEELKADVLHDGWKNRRLIAWISFLVSITYPLFVLVVWQFSEGLADKMIDLSVPVFALCGANLTWYFTMATWEDINRK
jgi:hypothetical protein